MPGKKRVSVETVYVTLTVPVGVHDRMSKAIEGLKLWDGQAAFIREAIVQKLRREGYAPAPPRPVRPNGRKGHKRP